MLDANDVGRIMRDREAAMMETAPSVGEHFAIALNGVEPEDQKDVRAGIIAVCLGLSKGEIPRALDLAFLAGLELARELQARGY